jgi:hypothetical protein
MGTLGSSLFYIFFTTPLHAGNKVQGDHWNAELGAAYPGVFSELVQQPRETDVWH